jgi:hypothetical protein
VVGVSFQVLARLSGLTCLHLSAETLHPDSCASTLRCVSHLPVLRDLHLNFKVSQEAVDLSLLSACSALTLLSVKGCDLGDDHVTDVSRIQSLERLCILDEAALHSIGAPGLIVLRTGLPSLHHLEISLCNLDAAGIEALLDPRKSALTSLVLLCEKTRNDLQGPDITWDERTEDLVVEALCEAGIHASSYQY